MGLFDAFKKKKDNNTSNPAQANAKPASANSSQKQLFQTIMAEADFAKRNNAIRAVTDQALLAEIARNGTYETDRTVALSVLTDQDLIYNIATVGANVPKVKSLAIDRLDDVHRVALIESGGAHESELAIAANKINDPGLLIRIIKNEKNTKYVRLCAAGKLERLSPERFAEVKDISDALREESEAQRQAAVKAQAKPKAPSSGYTEKDNMGTRQETISQANAYWMIERPGMASKPPFTLFTLPSASAAEKALLRLPFIRKASDSGKLICTRLMTFGFYETTLNGAPTGKYEVILSGSDLTLDEFNQAEKIFAQHGGTLRNHEAPSASVKAAASLGDPSKVRYSETVKGNDGFSTYEVYKGPDKASAVAFLKSKPVTRKFYYVVVDTPEGSFGRDINGFYQE